MPGAWCARSRAWCVVNTRVSHHGHTGNTRHSPRNGFNGFLRALPGDRACLPPSSADAGVSGPLGLTSPSANLTPASGRQDHTTSPSASGALVRSAVRVHRIPSRVRDDRDTPLVWDGMAGVMELIWEKREGIYFCGLGWTGGIRLIRFNKLRRARIPAAPPGSSFEHIAFQGVEDVAGMPDGGRRGKRCRRTQHFAQAWPYRASLLLLRHRADFLLHALSVFVAIF
jgi:hypothetical protein